MVDGNLKKALDGCRFGRAFILLSQADEGEGDAPTMKELMRNRKTGSIGERSFRGEREVKSGTSGFPFQEHAFDASKLCPRTLKRPGENKGDQQGGAAAFVFLISEYFCLFEKSFFAIISWPCSLPEVSVISCYTPVSCWTFASHKDFRFFSACQPTIPNCPLASSSGFFGQLLTTVPMRLEICC